MTFAAMLAALLAAPAWAHSLKALEGELFKREKFVEFVNRPAPDFTLRDADGRAVSLADLRDKVVVLYFIYASCPDICPLLSEKVAAVQQKVNRTPMREAVEFVAITTDPAHDAPDVLKAYGPAHGLDPANFVFLTSGPENPNATVELAARYGLKFTPTGDGGQMHAAVTNVIDREGRLRARLHGLRFDDTNAIVEINALVNDVHAPGATGEAAETAAPRGIPTGSSSTPAWIVPAIALSLAMAWVAGAIAFFAWRRRRRRADAGTEAR